MKRLGWSSGIFARVHLNLYTLRKAILSRCVRHIQGFPSKARWMDFFPIDLAMPQIDIKAELVLCRDPQHSLLFQPQLVTVGDYSEFIGIAIFDSKQMFGVTWLRTRFTTRLRYLCRQLKEANSLTDHDMSQIEKCNADGSSSEANLQKITEIELLQKIEEEEREWADRTEDLITNPDLVVDEEDTCGKTLPLKRLTLEELDLKRKTGEAVFRNIAYNEGELDRTDVKAPPSPSNPHPFDASKHAPPAYSRSLLPFVNHYPLLQTLVDVGMNLFEIEQSTRAGKFLLRLDTRKDLKPKLQWLVSLGFDPSSLGDYLTRNPFFLLQDLNEMQARVNYLTAMKFSSKDVCKIINDFRYWLNVDVKTVDSRLGWIQQQFGLSGDDVRSLIRKEARILVFGIGPLQRLTTLFNKEFGFTPSQIRRILLKDPRVFMMDANYVTANYGYVHKIMGLSNATIADHPLILRCSHSSIRNRHEFLKKLGRAIYEGAECRKSIDGDERKVDDGLEPLSLEAFLDPSDEVFVREAANTYLVVYNNFLRNH